MECREVTELELKEVSKQERPYSIYSSYSILIHLIQLKCKFKPF